MNKTQVEWWRALYAPHLNQISWDYQIGGGYESKRFPSLCHLNKMLQEGEALLWNPHLKVYGTLTWTPCRISKWRLEVGQYEIGDYIVWLIQPYFESKDKVWKWRVRVWDRKNDPRGTCWYEIRLTESQFRQILRNPRKASAYLERR